MAARGDRRLQVALRDLASSLTKTGAAWMVIGGIAVIARGVRRFTADIDVAVRGDAIEIDALLPILAKKRIHPRIEDAAAFARENLVLLLRHEPSGVDFDVSFAWTEFEHEAIEAATVGTFGTVKAPMARPEDLVVFKAIAGRGKDMDGWPCSRSTRSSTSSACGRAFVTSPPWRTPRSWLAVSTR